MTRRSSPQPRGARAPLADDPALRLFAPNTPILVVPGLHDSGPDHWQTFGQRDNPAFRRVVQPDFETPALDRWAAVIACAIDGAGAPPIVVAHSFGCLATVRAVYIHRRALAGALLVAPADPDG